MSGSLRIDMDIPMKMRDGVVLRSNIIRLIQFKLSCFIAPLQEVVV